MNNSIDKNNSIYKIRETYKLEWYWNGIIVKVPTRMNMDAKTLVFSIEPAGMYGYVFLMDKYIQGDKYDKQKILDSKYQTNTNLREIFQKTNTYRDFIRQHMNTSYMVIGLKFSTYRA